MGGEVTLRACRVSRRDVGRLSGSQAGRTFPLADSAFTEFTQLSVTDSGIGISPEGLGRLFTPFSQVDAGLARKFEGTGGGLARVEIMAELHGGSVAVETTPGSGSCFTVWLPVRAGPEDAVAPAKASAPVVTAGPRTALVVEDDLKSAELIRLQLEAEGFTVIQTGSAEAGLTIASQQCLSLIILDILLPNMDGWEFLARLRQVPSLIAIPVVIVSIVADRNRGFALGAAGVMQKPISRQDLYDSLVEIGLLPLHDGKALKVLVVDDDPKAVELIAVHVLGLSGSVLRAYGGQEGIDTAQRELPDLIVLDLMMPEIDGFHVAEALHAQPATAAIPILVVTAKEITFDDRARLRATVTTIMDKTTFDRDRFVGEVRRAMSGRAVAA